jgi:hypothetical protein
MGEFADMSSQQRRTARENFKRAYELPADQRQALAGASSPAERSERLKQVVNRRVDEYRESPFYHEFVADRDGTVEQAVDITTRNVERTQRHGLLRQWRILTTRAARIKQKDTLNTFILLAQAPIIATVLALVFAVGGAGTYFDGLIRGPSALFLLVASAVWFGCSNSAREIVSELPIYRRERMVNLMIPAYVMSKASVLGVLCALQCLMLLAIVYVPLQLEGGFLPMYLILVLTSWVGMGMGLTLSALVASAEASMALVPLLLIPQIILGGVIMPVHEMSMPMKVLSSTMAARHCGPRSSMPATIAGSARMAPMVRANAVNRPPVRSTPEVAAMVSSS